MSLPSGQGSTRWNDRHREPCPVRLQPARSHRKRERKEKAGPRRAPTRPIFETLENLTLLSGMAPIPGSIAGSVAPDLAAPGSLTADLGTTVQATETNSVAAGGQAVYRLQVAVSGGLFLTLTPGTDVQDGLILRILTADGQTVLASGPAVGTSDEVPQFLRIDVTQGQVVLLQVAGVDPTAEGSFTLELTNFDQYQTPLVRSVFLPTTGSPASLAIANLNGPHTAPDIIVSSNSIADPINILSSNGDGTFQAPRQELVGPGLSASLAAGDRQIAIADVNGDGNPDVIVPNLLAGDVSVMLGSGDGTLAPQRRFDALPDPNSLVTGDFDGDKNVDIAVLSNVPQATGDAKVAILFGNGDGTFQPALTVSTDLPGRVDRVVAGDFTGNGRDDLVVFSQDEARGELFVSTKDRTFQPVGDFNTGEPVSSAEAVDVNGDGKLDLVTTGATDGTVNVILGNGDGTFQPPVSFTARTPQPGESVQVVGLAVVDFGSPAVPNDPFTGPGHLDGHPDIIVTTESQNGPAELIMLPGQVDGQGSYTGFGAPEVLSTLGTAGPIATADFLRNGRDELVVGDVGGVRVFYSNPVTLQQNNSPRAARSLGGNSDHLVTFPQSIVSGSEDSYYKFTVPTEDDTQSGDQVIDFSANFQDLGDAGLGMEVLDSTGKVLGSGPRFRVEAPQGTVLTVHVFGQTAGDGTRGSGVYTLDIDVLPQVIASEVQAQPIVPGGPVTSLVVPLQGDRLDPSTAEDPANYTVTWLGPDGDQVIPIGAAGHAQAVIYNPGANIDVAAGLVYQSAERQTVTLLFAHPLPAGSYEVTLSPSIQAAAFRPGETAMLAGDPSFGGHPVVSVSQGAITNGSSVFIPSMVTPIAHQAGPLSISDGTPFLAQLTSDLSALLDEMIARNGDDPSITDALNNEILARFLPASGTLGKGTFTVLWFDPVSMDLQLPQGGNISYSQVTNQVTSNGGQTFVSVGGNVEVIVLANQSGTFNLGVSNVPATARGGAVMLSSSGSSTASFTDALRGGEPTFQVTIEPGSAPAVIVSSPPGPSGDSAGPPATPPSGFVLAQQTALTLASTVLITLPVGTAGSSTATEAAAAVESAAAAPTTGGAPINTPAPSSRYRTTGSSEPGDETNPGEPGRGGLNLQATFRFLRKVASDVGVVLEALGLETRLPTVRLWKGLLDVFGRSGKPPGGPGAWVRPPVGIGNTWIVPIIPPAEAAPAPEGQKRALIEGLLWDRGIESLVIDRDRSGAFGSGEESATETYLALVLLAAGTYQARLRALAGIKAKARWVTLSMPED